MYVLLKPIPSGLAVLVKEFELYVKKSGLDGVANLKGDQVPQQFVENILQVYNKFTAIVADVFNEDGDFVGALDKVRHAVQYYSIASTVSIVYKLTQGAAAKSFFYIHFIL